MFPFERIISIDRESKTPIYRQISISFINAISQGILKANTHLPSTRDLAKLLTVHRKTIIAAYQELEAQDWIVSVPRKYVVVSNKIPDVKPKEWAENSVNGCFYATDLDLPFKQMTTTVFPENDSFHPLLLMMVSLM